MVDSVVIQTGGESKEDPKHIEAMIAKVDAAAEAAAATSDNPTDLPASEHQPATKPDWVPDKFWDAEKGEVRTEALARSYRELESKVGGRKEEPAEGAPNSPEADPQAATQEDAAKALEAKNLNLEDFNKEFQANGTLSDESYKKLEEAGFPRSYVDAYIAGQQALAERFANEVKQVVGGDENFTAMVEWAANNVSQEEIDAYNRAVDSGDVNAAKLAVAGMYQKYQAARPDEPTLVQGSGGRVSADVYESRQQLTADMADPRYQSDPAFRRKVIEKLGRSDIL